MTFGSILLFSAIVVLCNAMHNVTIENNTGDADTRVLPIYEPFNMWQNATFTPAEGDLNPYNITTPITLTMSGLTKQAGISTMTLVFQGIAIYVNFVLTVGTTQLTFVLDGHQLPSQFTYQENKNIFVYNATVYSNSSVTSTGTGPDGLHNLTIFSPFPMTFDFAKYTVLDAGDPSPSSSTSTKPATTSTLIAASKSVTVSGGAIAGISISAILGVSALATAIILYKLARNRDSCLWRSMHDGQWERLTPRKRAEKLFASLHVTGHIKGIL